MNGSSRFRWNNQCIKDSSLHSSVQEVVEWLKKQDPDITKQEVDQIKKLLKEREEQSKAANFYGTDEVNPLPIVEDLSMRVP